MMCSKLLTDSDHESWLTRVMENFLHWLQAGYENSLKLLLPRPALMGLLIVGLTTGTYLLLRELPTAYVPEEDQGMFMTMLNGPEGASFEFMQDQMRQIEQHMLPFVESEDIKRILIFLPGWRAADSVNSAVSLVIMPTWNERKMSTRDSHGHFARRSVRDSRCTGLSIHAFRTSA